MAGLFNNFNPLFPLSDPITNKISEALPNQLRPIANPVGYALGKVAGPRAATAIVDPLNLSSQSKAGSKNMATILSMSEEDYNSKMDSWYG